MENSKAKNIIIVILTILLLGCLGIFIWQYVKTTDSINNNYSEGATNVGGNIQNNQQITDDKQEKNTNLPQEDTEVEDNENKQDQTTTKLEKEEIKYPTTNGPIFKYNIEDLNENVSNKKDEITYLSILNSNAYEISKDRKSITIKNSSIESPTLKFDKEIYHAYVVPYDQGQVDFWVILFRDGTIKYTKNYGETIKTGPSHIIDVFAVQYNREVGEGRSMAGSTVIVANEFGGLIDLMNYSSEN